MRAYLIAEGGSCHDGSLDKAVQLVKIAAAAGASACKFQFWSSAERLAERRRSGAHYEAIYRKYQMPVDWLPVLKETCSRAGIDLMATTYLVSDIALVAPYVDHFKVASFEAADMDFIRAHYAYAQRNRDRWVIVSTGLQETDTLKVLMQERRRAQPVTLKLLHCVSAYPAPVDHLHLRQIRAMDFDGFSDHAAAGWVASGAVAVALGAKILEVHLRLPETDEKNPDAPHALLPGQLRTYIQHVRTAEAAIGEESWRRPHNQAEDEMRKYRVAPGQP